jgi:Flp pilus assembly pilin Flp
MSPSTRPRNDLRRVGALSALLRLRARAREERAASAVEYAILVALIAAVIAVVVTSLGVSVHDLFDSLHF